jgi:hypothetical protein
VAMINKKEDWQAIVEQWQQSQKSIELFCKEQKLNSSIFHYWKKKLIGTNTVPSKFQIVSMPSHTHGMIEYIHPNGHKLIFNAPVSITELKKLFS